MFSTSSAQTEFIRALLNTNTYLKKCNFCSTTFYDLLAHQLTHCPNLTVERETLKNKLIFYGLNNDFPQKSNDLTGLLMYTLWNRNLLLALTDFLEDVKR